MTATVLDSLEDKYNFSSTTGSDDDDENFEFIVFVSNSPETKKGMYPPIVTLIDYDIEAVGGLVTSSQGRLSHIAELDLTDNLLNDWDEVLLLLKHFPALEFLNLSNNILCTELDEETAVDRMRGKRFSMRKLVLNGNRISWRSVASLTRAMPQLEELHLSTNDLPSPGPGEFEHANLRQLFLSCNPLSSLHSLSDHLTCPKLEWLSLAECPVDGVPEECNLKELTFLNLTMTRVSSWSEIDRLRQYSKLRELRVQHIPLLHEYTAHEKRMLLIARLPNVQILNGGDVISPNEREDAERAFIRFHMDLAPSECPSRYAELVDIHGQLDPLVNIDMRPDKHVKVQICHKDQVRDEVIGVYQTVQQLKSQLHKWFDIAPQNMKVYYCDKDLVELAGPEEMKWPQKALYTYNVQNGDKFIVDEKVSLGRIRTSSRSSLSSSLGATSGTSPSRHNISFQLTPKPLASLLGNSRSNPSKGAARNLFGTPKASTDTEKPKE